MTSCLKLLEILLVGSISLCLLLYKGLVTMQHCNSIHAPTAMISQGSNTFLLIVTPVEIKDV
jgi:hypothetical protein